MERDLWRESIKGKYVSSGLAINVPLRCPLNFLSFMYSIIQGMVFPVAYDDVSESVYVCLYFLLKIT